MKRLILIVSCLSFFLYPGNAQNNDACDCAYPIIFVHGWAGTGTSWSPIYNDSHFEKIWGGLNEDGFGHIYHAVLNAHSGSNIWGENNIPDGNVYVDDDVIVQEQFGNLASGLTSNCLYAINFNNWWEPDDPGMPPNCIFDSGNPNSNESDSNESSAIKQGYALSRMIKQVRQATGKDKVIIVAHSMGGIAAREYLQRAVVDANGQIVPHPIHGGIWRRWWVDPDDPIGGHKVAKLLTVGTPHRGSNMLSLGDGRINAFDFDLHSEAVRDLRTSYPFSGIPGVYFSGGAENNIPSGPGYHNRDVNCNGQPDDFQIMGLNNPYDGTIDNPVMGLPTNTKYTYYVANLFHGNPSQICDLLSPSGLACDLVLSIFGLNCGDILYGCGGDLIVDDERQWLFTGNIGSTESYIDGQAIPYPNDGQNYRASDRITSTNVIFHSNVLDPFIGSDFEKSETEDIEFVVRGLDEGDYPFYAHEIKIEDHLESNWYAGMVQIRADKVPDSSVPDEYNNVSDKNKIDPDWYKVTIPEDILTLELRATIPPGLDFRLDIYENITDLYSNANSIAGASFTGVNATIRNESVFLTDISTSGNTYYLRITHDLRFHPDPANAWKHPYKFKVIAYPGCIDPLPQLPCHCSNGEKDAYAGETGVDCGGPCEPCECPTQLTANGIPTLLFPLEGGKDDYNLDQYYQFGSNWEHNTCGGIFKQHVALDINTLQGSPVGRKVYAAYEGAIVKIGHSSTWAHYVTIEHNYNGLAFTTNYNHIQVNAGLSEGQYVSQGALLGVIEDISASPDHLHFGIRKAPYDASVSNRGSLPHPDSDEGGCTCNDGERTDPVFPEKFIDPKDVSYSDGAQLQLSSNLTSNGAPISDNAFPEGAKPVSITITNSGIIPVTATFALGLERDNGSGFEYFMDLDLREDYTLEPGASLTLSKGDHLFTSGAYRIYTSYSLDGATWALISHPNNPFVLQVDDAFSTPEEFSLQLASPISVSPTTLTEGGALSGTADVENTGNALFYGGFALVAKPVGSGAAQELDQASLVLIEGMGGAPNSRLETINFNVGGLQLQSGAGQYELYIIYFTSDGQMGGIVAPGSFQNPIVVEVAAPDDDILNLSPSQYINFGDVPINNTLQRYISINNSVFSPNDISGAISLSGPGFSIVTGGGSFVLTPGETQSVIVEFSPSSVASYNGILNISHDGDNTSPLLVSLSGEGSNTGCISVSAEITPTGCGANNGAIRLYVTSNSTYRLNWSTGSNRSPLEYLTSGAYGLTITNDQGCELIRTFIVPENDPPVVESVETSPANCNGDNGYARINIADGTGTPFVDPGMNPPPPYFKYHWGISCSGSECNLSGECCNLTPGTYYVTVEDAAGCEVVQPVNIGSTGTYPTVVLDSIQEPSCFGFDDGKIEFSVTGGTPPYEYRPSFGYTGTPFYTGYGNSGVIDNLIAGEYVFRVSDANNCDAIYRYDLDHPPLLTLDLEVNEGICELPGSAQAVPQGGNGQYSINWSNGSEGLISGNLTSGNYAVVVQDQKGCTISENFHLSQYDETEANFVASFSNRFGYFQNRSTGAQFFIWYFGDGTTSQDSNPIHIYNTDGVYEVCLISTNFCSTDTFCLDVTVQEGMPSETFQYLYSAEERNIEVEEVYSTPDGGFIIMAEYINAYYQETDALIIKTDADGNKLWGRRFGTENQDDPAVIVIMPDGSYFISGTIYDSFLNDYDVFIAKVSINGELAWLKRFYSDQYEFGNDLIATGESLFLCGYTQGFGSGERDGFIMKLDQQGNVQWSKTYGGSDDESFTGMVLGADGNIALCGYTKSFGNGNLSYFQNVLFTKVDQNGNVLTVKAIGDPSGENERASDIRAITHPDTNEEAFLIRGYSSLNGLGFNNQYLNFIAILNDDSGIVDEAWVLNDNTSDILINDLAQINNGFLLAAKFNYTNDNALVKLNEQFGIEWCRRYGDTGQDFINSIYPTTDGGIIAAGEADAYEEYEAWVVKYDSYLEGSCGYENVPVNLVGVSSYLESLAPAGGQFQSASFWFTEDFPFTQDSEVAIESLDPCNIQACLLTINLEADQSEVCQGETINFTADCRFEESVTWYLNGDSIGIGNTESITFDETGFQVITAIAANSICTKTVSDTIGVFPFDPNFNIDYQVENASGHFAQDGNILLDVSGAYPPFEYQWSNGVSSSSNQGVGAGMYDVTVTYNQVCETRIQDIEVIETIVESASLQRQYFLQYNFEIKEASQLPGGDYIVVGVKDRSPIVARMDIKGAVKWSRTYSNLNSATLGQCNPKLALTSDGAFIYVFFNYSKVLVKFDAEGAVQWSKQYTVNPYDGDWFLLNRIKVLSNGNLFGVGAIYMANVNDFRLLGIKISSSGDEIFTTRYGGGDGDSYLYDFCETPDGEIMMVGSWQHDNRSRAFIAKTYNAGYQTDWNYLIGGNSYHDNGSAYSIERIGSYYYIAGYLNDQSASQNDYFIMKFNGQFSWIKTLPPAGNRILAKSYDGQLLFRDDSYFFGRHNIGKIEINTGTIMWVNAYANPVSSVGSGRNFFSTIDNGIFSYFLHTDSSGHSDCGYDDITSQYVAQTGSFMPPYDFSGNNNGSNQSTVWGNFALNEFSLSISRTVICPECDTLSAEFLLSNTLNCLEDTLTAVPVDTSSRAEYFWAFDGKLASTADSLFYPLTNNGVFDLQLLLKKDVCQDTSTHFVVVGNPAIQLELGPPRTVCMGTVLDCEIPGQSYEWSTGDTTQTTGVHQSGTYSVTVTDASVCQYIDSIQVTVVDHIEVTATKEDASCFGYENGAITLDVQNASSPISFLWNTGASERNLTQLPAGQYGVTVSDAQGCLDSLGIDITEPPGSSITEDVTHPTCGFYDGSIQLATTGNFGPYSYRWNNGSGEDNLSNVRKGAYSVTVTDAFECEQVRDYNLDCQQPGKIQLANEIQANPHTCRVNGSPLDFSFTVQNIGNLPWEGGLPIQLGDEIILYLDNILIPGKGFYDVFHEFVPSPQHVGENIAYSVFAIELGNTDTILLDEATWENPISFDIYTNEDADQDGYFLCDDCNDADPSEHPGQIWYLDSDGDGYSNGTVLNGCERPVYFYAASELAGTQGDCDDENPAIYPGAAELCDGIDNNCNGLGDEPMIDGCGVCRHRKDPDFVPVIEQSSQAICYGGEVTFSVYDGKRRCLEFDGADDYIAVGFTPILEITDDITIEMWVYPNHFSHRQPIFKKAIDGEGAIFIETDSTLSFNFGYSGADVSPSFQFQSNGNLQSGAWNHIALVRDVSNNIITWYLNGEKGHEENYTGPPPSTSDLTLWFGYDGEHHFSGMIDEVRLWNAALDSASVSEWYNKELNDSHPLITNLIGRWDFEEGYGQVAFDQSLAENDGVINGGMTWNENVPDFKVDEYIWNTGETGKEILVKAFLSGTYTVRKVTQLDTCFDLVNLFVSRPSGEIITDAKACDYQSGGATASPRSGVSPYSFAWQNGDITKTTTITESGNVALDITDALGCRGFATGLIPEIHPAILANDSLIIEGDSVFVWVDKAILHEGKLVNWIKSQPLRPLVLNFSEPHQKKIPTEEGKFYLLNMSGVYTTVGGCDSLDTYTQYMDPAFQYTSVGDTIFRYPFQNPPFATLRPLNDYPSSFHGYNYLIEGTGDTLLFNFSDSIYSDNCGYFNVEFGELTFSPVEWNNGASTDSILFNADTTELVILRLGAPPFTCSDTLVITVKQAIQLNVLAILQGAYNNSSQLMRDDLRALGLIPLQEPYGSMGYAGALSEEVIDTSTLLVVGSDAVVDWVFIELRDPGKPDSTIAARSALLQRDGNVVDLDGTSLLRFLKENINSTHAYIAVRHRNHLGVMTASPVPLTDGNNVVDFTDVATPTWGNNARIFQNGRMMLWPGNGNGDGRVVYQGSGTDLLPISISVFSNPLNTNFEWSFPSAGYKLSDYNMDGTTIYQGSGTDLLPISISVFSNPLNTNFEWSFPVLEQLPENF